MSELDGRERQQKYYSMVWYLLYLLSRERGTYVVCKLCVYLAFFSAFLAGNLLRCPPKTEARSVGN